MSEATNESGAVEPYVSVRGEAMLEVEAETARLVFTVSARDRDRAHAMASLATRAGEVLDGLRAFGDAVETIETTAVRVYPAYREGHGRERIEGYVAQVTHTATVVDFTVIGDLVDRVGEGPTTEISGPWWGLRPLSDHHRRARVAAVEDARLRAEQYAAALGGRVTGLVHLADAGLLAAGPGLSLGPPGMPGMGMHRAMATGGEAAPVVDLVPERQIVRATVEARFTMSTPSFAAPEGT